MAGLFLFLLPLPSSSASAAQLVKLCKKPIHCAPHWFAFALLPGELTICGDSNVYGMTAGHGQWSTKASQSKPDFTNLDLKMGGDR
jgi:hypothetical protein